jgi:hypothetical protein
MAQKSVMIPGKTFLVEIPQHGLRAAMNAVHGKVGTEMDGLRTEMDGLRLAMNEVGTEMDGLRLAMNEVGTKLDQLWAKMDGLRLAMDGVSAAVEEVRRMQELAGVLERILERPKQAGVVVNISRTEAVLCAHICREHAQYTGFTKNGNEDWCSTNEDWCSTQRCSNYT